MSGPKYDEVVRQLGGERDRGLGRFRELGGERDRWGARDYAIMADCLTRAEERLEIRRGRTSGDLRGKLRDLRRRLEGRA